MNALSPNGLDVLDGLRKLPGGPELCKVAEARSGEVALIGGAVRDLLLGRTPRELDVVVDDAADDFARELARELQTLAGESPQERFETTFHDRFHTALVHWGSGQIDVATRRSECYPAPGSLPEVGAGTPASDLERRDFTINTLSVVLNGSRRGELTGAATAREDLDAGLLRILHAESFRDDPTRILRLARYAVRLGFEPDERTAELALEAVRDGALATISRARFGAELRLALAEPDPVATLGAFDELGALLALHPAVRFDRPLARNALAELQPDGRGDVLLLAALLLSEQAEGALRALLDELEFTAGERDAVVRTATVAPLLVDQLAQARTPWQIRQLAQPATLEAVALAAALAGVQDRPEAAAAARSWLIDVRHVRLQISGDDLLAAGLAAGPDIGIRLERVLRLRLDGELSDGRAAELDAALEGI